MTTVNSINASVSQYTTFLTVGVTNRLDVSVALPIVGTDVTVISDATIHRLGTTNPLTHFFRMADGEVGDRRLFTARSSTHGIGDLTIRLKDSLRKSGESGFAVGLDVRLPTGDEMALTGTGTIGLQPFAHLVRHIRPSVAACERRVPMERFERAGRQPGHRRFG